MKVMNEETAKVASLMAKLFEGITSERIPLDTLEKFVNSGRIEGAPGSLPIGSLRNLPCNGNCNRETMHLLSRVPCSLKEPRGQQIIRWVCQHCGRSGPTISYTDY